MQIDFLKAGIQIADNDAKYIVKLAKQHNALQVHACNRGLTNEETRTEATIEESIKEIAREYGLRAVFSGDPRGFTVKLKPLDGSDASVWNTWGGKTEGYGIGESE